LLDHPGIERLDNLKLAVENAAGKLPAEVGGQLRALMTPGALAVMAGVTGTWAVAHFFGVGQVADLTLLILGVAAFGGAALEAGKEMVAFATTDDVDAAGSHLANAVSLIGVQTVMAILLKKAPRTFQPDLPFRCYRGGPRIPGTWFYKPKTFRLPGGKSSGATSVWADIRISTDYPLEVQRLSLYHERIHSFLTPKLYVLRELRVSFAASAYERSYLLRYLEEAWCETFALLRVHGFSMRNVITGVKFPIVRPYVITVADLRMEASGILLGPINVGSMVFHVYGGHN